MAAPSKKTRTHDDAPPPLANCVPQPVSYLAAGEALASGHVAQFYQTDAFLVEAIADFVRVGLEAGDVCLLVVTQAHREQLRRRSRMDELDLDAAQRQGSFVWLDAEAMLRHLLGDAAMPERGRFDAVVGSQVEKLTGGGRQVRVFGEMVAPLWASGNQTGAIRLEKLWNALQDRIPHLALCCAYPMDGMAGTANAALFAEVCGQHTHVMPDESYTTVLSAEERLRAITLLQQRSRSLEVEVALREQAEERLRASEGRYRRLFETALDGILLVDPRTRTVTDANPATVALLGLAHAQIIGRELWQVGLFPDRERADAMLQKLEERRTLRCDTLPLQRPDGPARYVEFVSACFLASGDEVIQCTLRDVTERRLLEQRTEAALTALLMMAETLVSESPASANDDEASERAAEDAPPGVLPPPGVASTARRLADLMRSVLTCEQLSIASIEPESDRMRPLTLVGFSPEHERHWWAGWRAETTVSERLGWGVAARLHAGEMVVLDATQSPHWERLGGYDVQTLLLVPARIGDKLVGGLALHYDEREQIETEHERMLAGAVAQLVGLVIERDRLLREREEARASAIALREANRRMSEFLSIASHELKTPVTVIKANLQLCARRLRRPMDQLGGQDAAVSASDLLRAFTAAEAVLDRTGRGADRLVRLVDDLLDASRIQAGRLELRSEPDDLVSIVRDAVEEQRQANPNRAIRFTAPRQELLIIADRERIGQVVTNYLTNALKYSAMDRPVDVYVEADRQLGAARVRVRDAGPGLPPEEYSLVWEQFHRVADIQVQSGSGVGLGLGLHICKTIVEQHGGQVGLESAVGDGSTFWFTLPLQVHTRTE